MPPDSLYLRISINAGNFSLLLNGRQQTQFFSCHWSCAAAVAMLPEGTKGDGMSAEMGIAMRHPEVPLP